MDTPSRPNSSPVEMPRWLQIAAGAAVAAVSLLCMSASVAAAFEWEPGIAVSALGMYLASTVACAWLLVLAFRLLTNRRVAGGLMGVRSLRISSAAFLLLPVAGFFTGFYRDGGVLAVCQSGIFVAAALGLWSLARNRARAA